MIDAWMQSRAKRSPPKQQLHLQQDALIRELFDSFITDREFDDKDHIKKRQLAPPVIEKQDQE